MFRFHPLPPFGPIWSGQGDVSDASELDKKFADRAFRAADRESGEGHTGNRVLRCFNSPHLISISSHMSASNHSLNMLSCMGCTGLLLF